MSTICNKYVAAGLSNLFGKTDHANCTVVFTVARKPVQEPLVAGIAPAREEGRREGDGRTHDNCADNGANPGEQATSEPSQSESSDADDLEDNLLPAAEALTLSFEEKRWLAMNAGAYSTPGHGASEHAQAEVGFVGEPLPAHTFVLCLASERFQTQMERWADEPATAGPGSPEPATSKASGAATTLVGGVSAADGVGASAKAAGATEAAGATAEGGSAAAESCSGAAVGESEATAEADSGATTVAADATAAASGGAVLEAGVVTAEAGNAAATEAGVGATAEAGGGAAAADDGATARAGSGAATEAAEAAAMAAETGGQATAMAGGRATVEVGCQTRTAEPEPAKQQNGLRQREPPRPLELRVRLGGEEELPAALAAIKFAYTGRIEAGSAREVLRVWKQADYLQMKGCVEACVDALRDKLGLSSAAQPCIGGSAGGAIQPSASASASTMAAPVLQLYGCTPLWPDPEHEPAFAALLAEAKPQLVAHFGDALAVLNKQQLYDQMRALPAVGLEALLESEDFGTDSESSVVLVLAEWMQVNYGTTDAATRRRLCGLLRLSQCSRAYLDWVLPALALDHLLHPNSQAGWLSITPEQAGYVAYFARASFAEKMPFFRAPEETGCPATWLISIPRRCVVPADGHAYTFSISREVLCTKFGALAKDQAADIDPDMDDTPSGNLCAMGLEWYPSVSYTQGLTEAGLWLTGNLPEAYNVGHAGSSSSSSAFASLARLRRPVAMLPCRLLMQVGSSPGGSKYAVCLQLRADMVGCFGRPVGERGAIHLAEAPAPPAPPKSSQQHAAGGQGQQDQEQQRRAHDEAAVAAQWARFLKDGRVRGKIVVS